MVEVTSSECSITTDIVVPGSDISSYAIISHTFVDPHNAYLKTIFQGEVMSRFNSL
jgi:hypothetical protein